MIIRMMKFGVQFYSRQFLMALLATIIGVGVSSVSMAAGPACKALFSEAPILEMSHSETRYSFLPEHVRLTRKSSQDYVVEYVYTVQGYPRLKKMELAMDSADVVDANLNSGRELLNAILNHPSHNKSNSKSAGSFIFIDVNNLGWVNKNFFDKTQAGDSYLFKTITAIQKVIEKNGLIFRLGGDEFGIVIETQDPQVIQKVMKDLQTEIHKQAHSVFREETQRRAAAFRIVHQRYKNNEISEAEYQAAYADFKTYTSYSQEGVSMGAAHIDGTSAEAIQNRAEKMATEMKIKIKQAFNLDTSKYTGGVNLSNVDQNIRSRFRADIPALEPLPNQNLVEVPKTSTDSLQIQKREAWFSSVPAIKSQRTSDVLRYGKIGIGKYKNELTTEEYRLEKYDLGGLLLETRPLELNNNTRFIDARSQAAKTVINEVIDKTTRPEHRGGRAILVSLLNLGKLNYFHKKTATGDQALGLAASALRKELGDNLVPFKSNGSDFFILSVGMNKEELVKYKQNLEEKLNASSEVDRVFLSEIEYIERTETDVAIRRQRIEEIRNLMAKKFQVQ